MEKKAKSYEKGKLQAFIKKTGTWINASDPELIKDTWGEAGSLQYRSYGMMCYLDEVTNHPDVLFQELQKLIDDDTPTFPKATNDVCTDKDDFILDCNIKGNDCETVNKADKRNNNSQYATIERISDPNYCQCFTIKPVS